jgi:hypothetical protein
MNRKIALLPLAALALAGCSMANTAPDMVALKYNGGMIESKTFESCIPSSTRDYSDGGDQYYAYPSSQRYYEFDSSKETDAKSVTFVTKDGIEMTVNGILNFDLETTDCATLQRFHELIGNRLKMYWEGDTSEGWGNGLDKFLWPALKTAVDRAGQNYTYTSLYNDPATKALWEKDVLTALPDLVNRQTDGEEVFFKDFAVTIQKPEPPQTIKDALVEQQAAVARAAAAKAEADAQVKTANAQIELQNAEAKKAEPWVALLGKDGYIEKMMIEKGLNPKQPSSALVTVP